MAERGESKNAKRSKNQNLRYFDAKLRFALLAALRTLPARVNKSFSQISRGNKYQSRCQNRTQREIPRLQVLF